MLREKLASALSVSRRSLESLSAKDFEQVERHFGELLSTARETSQESLKDLYLKLVATLKSDRALTAAEQELIRVLVIGDAEFYLKYENNFDDWVVELKRLLAEMNKLQSSGLEEVGDVLHLRALAQDASRVVADISFYLNEKDRVACFNQNVGQDLNLADRKFLAGIICHKMTSSQY